MRYVILRDDDTNALTPVSCLERLYRPFLDRGLPVNLATIPNVCSDIRRPDGHLEIFLMARTHSTPRNVPIGCNNQLVEYLLENPGFHIVQHGYQHEPVNRHCEFDHDDRADIARRLDEGAKCLMEAGFPRPDTFVAPYDQISRVGLEEISSRFRVLSTGWYDLEKLPVAWWPRYLVKKALRRPHWRVGRAGLLTHPGCLLSYHRPYSTMLDTIKSSIDSRRVTVLVTHWWEYFRENRPDDAFIGILHETADYLASRKDVRVVPFKDVANQTVPLN